MCADQVYVKCTHTESPWTKSSGRSFSRFRWIQTSSCFISPANHMHKFPLHTLFRRFTFACYTFSLKPDDLYYKNISFSPKNRSRSPAVRLQNQIYVSHTHAAQTHADNRGRRSEVGGQGAWFQPPGRCDATETPGGTGGCTGICMYIYEFRLRRGEKKGILVIKGKGCQV
ncbi:hypothetical protein XENORESO_013893 [Xenotaenia resolanae]|uniref:Uncharacterized protein n=1 Tax=Xenotaenia resolanae TaxID=208358 RepID=A0ABV0X0H5_9TELE